MTRAHNAAAATPAALRVPLLPHWKLAVEPVLQCLPLTPTPSPNPSPNPGSVPTPYPSPTPSPTPSPNPSPDPSPGPHQVQQCGRLLQRPAGRLLLLTSAEVYMYTYAYVYV